MIRHPQGERNVILPDLNKMKLKLTKFIVFYCFEIDFAYLCTFS